MPINTCMGHKATSCCCGENVQCSLHCSSMFGLHQSFHHFLSDVQQWNSGICCVLSWPHFETKIQEPEDIPAHTISQNDIHHFRHVFVLLHLVFVVQIKQRGRGHAAPGHVRTAHRGTLAFWQRSAAFWWENNANKPFVFLVLQNYRITAPKKKERQDV